MMCVPTYTAPSGIHGMGVFAKEPIAKGTLVWTFVDGFDIMFSDDTIARLPPQARETVQTYGYRSNLYPGQVLFCSDMGRHINHSYEPNTYENENAEETYAVRDIAAGEEITCDYRDANLPFYTENPWYYGFYLEPKI